MYHATYFLLLLIVFSGSISLASDYKAQNFFVDAKTEYIATEEEISERQKQSILNSKFLKNRSICDQAKDSSDEWFETWFVDINTPNRLVLGQCSGSTVEIHLYKFRHGGYLVAVVSVMGNHGQTQDFRFFSVSSEGEILKEMRLADVNVQDVRENEFLSQAQRLPARDNGTAQLWVKSDALAKKTHAA